MISIGHDSVEVLTQRLAEAVAERQALRAAGAEDEALERNRLEIGMLQRRIAEALIARHLPAAA